jgi:predicted flap endonuclease-1-like 5' DNA nuclease
MNSIIVIGADVVVFMLLLWVYFTMPQGNVSKSRKSSEMSIKEEKHELKKEVLPEVKHEPLTSNPEPVIPEQVLSTPEPKTDTIETQEVEDLDELSGIGEKYRNLLRATGVKSISGLAKQNPEDLLVKLSEENKKAQIVKRLPSKKNLDDWVERAKTQV